MKESQLYYKILLNTKFKTHARVLVRDPLVNNVTIKRGFIMSDQELTLAIAQIKNANQNGFISFYNKTFHYNYVRAKYLFPNIVK